MNRALPSLHSVTLEITLTVSSMLRGGVEGQYKELPINIIKFVAPKYD